MVPNIPTPRADKADLAVPETVELLQHHFRALRIIGNDQGIFINDVIDHNIGRVLRTELVTKVIRDPVE